MHLANPQGLFAPLCALLLVAALSLAACDEREDAAVVPPVVLAPTAPETEELLVPPPEAVHERAPDPSEPAPLSTPGLWLVGGDDAGLLYSLGGAEGSARVDVGVVKSVRFMGCGSQVAYLSDSDIRLVTVLGADVAQVPVPDFHVVHGERFVDYIAQWYSGLRDVAEARALLAEESGGRMMQGFDLEALSGPEAVARTQNGTVAIDPWIDGCEISGEDGSCRQIDRHLRLRLELDGLDTRDCEWPERTAVLMPKHTWERRPNSWQCTHVTLAQGHATLRALRHSDEYGVRDGSDWLHSVEICRVPGDPERRTVSILMHVETGYDAPAIYVMRDDKVEAALGRNGRVVEYPGVRLWGGDRGWFVQAGTEALYPLGDVEPDAVMVPAVSSPSNEP